MADSAYGQVSGELTPHPDKFDIAIDAVVGRRETQTQGSLQAKHVAPSVGVEAPALILSLIVSLIVTWALGLAPSLLIRYALMRRPLSKKSASWTAATVSVASWMAFIVFHTARGERPGNGTAWIFVFLVARWIMSRGGSPSVPAATPRWVVATAKTVAKVFASAVLWLGVVVAADSFDRSAVAWAMLTAVYATALAFIWTSATLQARVRERSKTWLSREWRLVPFYAAAALVSIAALRYIVSE